MVNNDIALLNNDLLIANGDLTIGASDVQHIQDTINAFPGWWKNYPADGVGIFQYVNSIGQDQTIKRSIAINLQSDGYLVSNPQVITNADGTMIIKPNATI
jgi:hypothetical protein